jgi:hypothetical protein
MEKNYFIVAQKASTTKRKLVGIYLGNQLDIGQPILLGITKI